MATPAVNSPVCPLCQGTGWRLLAPAAGEVTGRAVACQCRREQRAERLVEDAGIPPRYRHCTLEDFDPQPYTGASESLGWALLVAKRFVENYPGDRSGLLLLGPCGVGKTHLAVGIMRKLIEQRGAVCRFADYRELLKRIQSTYDPLNPESEASVIEPLLSAEVLVLDDLGVGRATEWAIETLHYLLNYRYSHELTSVLTTNLEDGEARRSRLADGTEFEPKKMLAAAIGERLRSRLFEMCRPVTLAGEDFRRRIHSNASDFRARD